MSDVSEAFAEFRAGFVESAQRHRWVRVRPMEIVDLCDMLVTTLEGAEILKAQLEEARRATPCNCRQPLTPRSRAVR